MQPAEAIGILRGDISPASVLHRPIAENMGAEALEFLAGLMAHEADLCCTINSEWMVTWLTNTEQRRVYGVAPQEAMQNALAEWRKETGRG